MSLVLATALDGGRCSEYWHIDARALYMPSATWMKMRIKARKGGSAASAGSSICQTPLRAVQYCGRKGLTLRNLARLLRTLDPGIAEVVSSAQA